MSIVASDSSPDLTSSAELTSLREASRLTPASISRASSSEVIVESTAAAPPLPIPSDRMTFTRPPRPST